MRPATAARLAALASRGLSALHPADATLSVRTASGRAASSSSASTGGAGLLPRVGCVVSTSRLATLHHNPPRPTHTHGMPVAPSLLLTHKKNRDELSTTRTFSPADVAAFTRLTGDANPLHHDHHTGEASGGGGRPPPPVPGLLTASLFPALVGSAWPGAVYARQTLRFSDRLGVGDAVAAAVRVERVRVRSGGGGGSGGSGEAPPTAVVTFATTARRVGGDGRVLVQGEAVAVLPVAAGGVV
jgi:acyl dehydratase